MFNENDESVVEHWVENPYWQYFCGYEYLQHELPLHPTILVRRHWLPLITILPSYWLSFIVP